VKKGVRGRALFILGIVVVSIVYFIPSVPIAYQGLPDWWKSAMPSKGITLGLDLQGGLYLTLLVEQDKAVENSVDRMAQTLGDLFKEKKIDAASVKRTSLEEITVHLASQVKLEDARKAATAEFPNIEERRRGENELVLGLVSGEAQRIRDQATSQALETIRNRIDKLGVVEPLIQRQGRDQIVVQLPGIKDPQHAISLIGKTALLEFKLVDDQNPLQRELPPSVSVSEAESLAAEFAERLGAENEILFERRVDVDTRAVTLFPLVLKRRALITGDLLSSASTAYDEFNQPYVSITFDKTGAALFDKVTAEHVKRRMAIILDNTVYSAPVIQERISGGRAQITGSFTVQEASDLALVLRAGSLAAPVQIIQNLSVGHSLGRDSIEKGIWATIIAGIFVILFMVVYYKLSGVIADFALILNLIVLIGALAALNATLTLPGIAGIILTIGMGVDSNVLIFERIREEIRSGKPVRLAVDGGYSKAFLTIVDSHVTTLITALVLFLFGTGPIKGFAVTLSLGITINLFTALVGTKVVFDYVNSRRKLTRLSI
jgi:preprotein translocase subunit SecD